MAPVIYEEGTQRSRRPRRIAPIQAIALSFFVIIAVGTLLLMLPVSHQPGRDVGLLDALFTATSATCVTGLATLSTAETWSRFGQGVIVSLIQLGGLGYMTVATIVALMLGLRVGIRTRLQLREAHGVFGLRDAVQVVRYVAVATLIIETVGALLLFWRFARVHGHPLEQAAFEGVFYSISAFCNAGFDLAPGFNGLADPALRVDIWLLLIIGTLIILGGLGFGVLAELLGVRKRRISLHAKLVLITSGVLIVVGMLLFMLFEMHNDETLGVLEPVNRVVTSWFMAVTPRTAGFSPIDLTLVSPPTLFIIGLLMIIGGSPDSTAGGVKTTTFAIIVLAIAALVRKRQDIEVFHRRIGGEQVRLALSLVSIYLLAVLLVIMGISVAEISLVAPTHSDATMTRYGRLMFEVVSAFGTVGLSAGITPTLTPVSKVLLILGMYVGRLGPLGFVFVFAQQWASPLRRLPQESVMTG